MTISERLPTLENSLLRDLFAWRERICRDDIHQYLIDVNRRYDSLVGQTGAQALVELRLVRSQWAKRIATAFLTDTQHSPRTPAEFRKTLQGLSLLSTLLSRADVDILLKIQSQFGDRRTAKRLADILAEHADPSLPRDLFTQLDPSGRSLLLRGPAPLKSIRPIRASKRLDPNSWLLDPAMSQLQFIGGDPDCVRVRGMELRSGDIGIVELNHCGDGIFDSFLCQPGLAPHAMLYVSRRVYQDGQPQPLIQPSLVEIYEGGWRSVPLTTGLSPRFSWYSEWVRPAGLSHDIGERLSRQLDTMEPVAFDFQSRRIPSGGAFPASWGLPSASCTNLIRLPFERAGVELPYPTTRIDAGAVKNLITLGLGELETLHTPMNILNDSGFAKVGVVDNGCPEISYAQALVVGRPDQSHTFGGHFCQRSLILEHLPNWRSVGAWKSDYTALLVKLGQSDAMLGEVARWFAGYSTEAIPRTASPTTIAFYLRSEFEAGHLIKAIVHPEILRRCTDEPLLSLSKLQSDNALIEMIRSGISSTALVKERWYGSLA